MTLRAFTFVLLASCWSCAAPSLLEAPPAPVILQPTAAPMWLGTRVGIAVDVDPALELDEVLTSDEFFLGSPHERPSFRLGQGVIWLRVTMQADPTARAVPWVLAFSHPRPRRVTLYPHPPADGAPSGEGGLLLPADRQVVRSRSVVIPVPIDQPGTHTFYVRLETFPVGFSGVLTTLAQLQEEEVLESAVLGLYYGGVLALLIYNLVLFVMLRRRPYLLFAGLAVAHALYFLGRNGWLWRLGLWTATPQHTGGLVASVTIILLLVFTMDVLGTRTGTPRLHRFGRWILGAGALNALLALMGLGWLSDPIVVPLGLLTVAVVWTMALRQMVARQAGAGSYFAGFATYLAGIVLYIAKIPGWVPHNAFTEHAMQVGSALNLALSSLALVQHVRWLEERQRREAHERQALAATHEREVARLHAEALGAALRAQNEERHRIARDLHDGLGHLLLRVITAARKHPGATELHALVGECITTVRAVSHRLYPTTLDTLGLSSSLQALAEETVHHTDVGLSLEIAPIDNLVETAAQAEIYRIVQQALANAITHGHPRNLSVEALHEEDVVVVAVTDDGVGYDGVRVGSGLRNMKQRAEIAGGTLIVDSTPGEGTRVELRLPAAPHGSHHCAKSQ